jgi:hypothetical protein
MNHVVSFSTGILSALALERVINRYGRESVTGIFMDTRFEDDDNYRFMADVEKYLQIEIVKIQEGRDPYEVSHAEHVIPNSRVAPCTTRLKIEPFREWLKEQEKPITVHIGYDYAEMHRCEPVRRNYEGLGYSVDFPMLWQPYEFRDYKIIMREDWGIEPPRMYAIGYTHANCGGRCVKQGHGDWIRTLLNFPERYAAIEQWEAEMRENPTNEKYAILKDRSGGGLAPLTLRELRERYAAKQTPTLFEMDTNSACVTCGMGE